MNNKEIGIILFKKGVHFFRAKKQTWQRLSLQNDASISSFVISEYSNSTINFHNSFEILQGQHKITHHAMDVPQLLKKYNREIERSKQSTTCECIIQQKVLAKNSTYLKRIECLMK